jgi:hypothetical protein
MVSGECVEAAALPGSISVRDSRDSAGRILHFRANTWRSFVDRLKSNDAIDLMVAGVDHAGQFRRSVTRVR